MFCLVRHNISFTENIKMLSFTADDAPARLLAVHYAKQIGDTELIRFMSSEIDIESAEAARSIISGFSKMTALAADDFEQDRQIEGIADIEFWMHKLFNKVYGYMSRHGFQNAWDNASWLRR